MLIQVFHQPTRLGEQQHEEILEAEKPVSRQLWLGLSLSYFCWELHVFLLFFILSKKINTNIIKPMAPLLFKELIMKV